MKIYSELILTSLEKPRNMFWFQLVVKNIINHFVFVVFANQFKAKCIKFSHSLRLYVLKLQMLFVST